MFERLGRWTWDRYKHRWGLVLATVFGSIFTFVLVPPSIFNVAAVFELSIGQALAIYGVIALGGFLVHFFGMILSTTSQRAAISAWAAGDRTDPDAVREAALYTVRDLLPRLMGLVSVPALVVFIGPLAWYMDVGWRGGLAIGFQTFGLVLADALLTVIGFEALFRPLRAEVDEVAPAPPEGRGLPVARRLLFAACALAWALGVMTPAIVIQFESPSVRFGVAGVAAAALALTFVYSMFSSLVVEPVLGPLDDLLRGTRRVAAGVYDTRLPLTSDDEFGEVIHSFNEMQAGLLERERLHAAFGSYVDPALAERLIAQGDDLFAGEEVEVTVFFADVRNFTPYVENTTAREAVERLNALFGLVVPILRGHHGHANKFLGDGVLAVFGVPESIPDHADQALAAAWEIQTQVHATFGSELQLGIGINTGRVIAGTIGGGGKLEFTLIGDAVNVAARVEERTKTTGDAILLTQSTLDALSSRPTALVERGDHELKGKTAATRLYAL